MFIRKNQKFPLYFAIKQGLTLVEASAGTGKTYSLVRVVARQLIELNIPVEKILIVTFTKAATAELHTRLFELLNDIFTQLTTKVPVDQAENIDLVDKWKNSTDKESYIKRLQLAISNFDQAKIFTIDGFFQRLQQDTSLLYSFPTDFDLITEDNEFLEKAINHYWRKHTYALSEEHYQKFINFLHKDKLKKFVAHRRQNPTVKLDKEYSQDGTIEGFLKLENEVILFLKKEKSQLIGLIAPKPEGINNKVKTIWKEGKGKDGADSLVNDLENDSLILTKENYEILELFIHSATSTKIWKKDTQAAQEIFFTPIKRDFFTQLETKLDELKKYEEALTPILIAKAATEVISQVNTLKNQAKIQTHSDITESLYKALNSNSKHHLVKLARTRYTSVFIDEFQDTSPQQCHIFTTLFKDPVTQQDSPYFFIIGDPKQSIYKFRGADVYSYLEVATQADCSFTLDTNYRSNAHCVSACNAIFSQASDPFLTEERIKFTPVNSHDTSTDIHNTGLVIKQIDDTTTKTALTAKTVTDIVYEISTLIASGIKPSAIAILISKNNDVNAYTKALHQANISYSRQTSSSVFSTVDAQEFKILLHSLIHPKDIKALRCALLLPALGQGKLLPDIDSSLISEWKKLHELWINKGLLTMVRSLEESFPIKQNLLLYPDALRKITNFAHLTELLNKHEKSSNISPNNLISWLELASNGKLNSADNMEQELRIETDKEAIQFLTQFKSKGLEFDYVFLPTGHEAQVLSPEKTSTIYHDEQLQPRLSTAQNHIEKRTSEGLADQIRLLYVSLTRAKLQCYLYINKKAKNCLLRDSILDNNTSIEDLINTHKGIKQKKLIEEIPPPLKTIENKEKILKTQNPLTSIPAQQKTTSSFSGITRGLDNIADYDFIAEPPQLHPTNDSDYKNNWECDTLWDDFKAGADLGLVLHEVFEKIDFKRFSDTQHIQEIVIKKLDHYLPFHQSNLPTSSQRYAISVKLTKFIQKWLTHKIDADLTLSNIEQKNRLIEPRFLLSAQEFSLEKFAYFLEESTPKDLPDSYTNSLKQLSSSQLSGFLDGFIDLIFHHQGRYHILDWKTNQIQKNNHQYLADKMADSHYFLQYHIYLLALDRLLNQSLKDHYSPEQHLGNVYYIFLRGLDLNRTGSGVYSSKLSPANINRLRQLASCS